VRRIRARMREIIKNHVGNGDLQQLVKKLVMMKLVKIYKKHVN